MELADGDENEMQICMSKTGGQTFFLFRRMKDFAVIFRGAAGEENSEP